VGRLLLYRCHRNFVRCTAKTSVKSLADKLAHLSELRQKFEAANDLTNLGLVERNIAALAALSTIEKKPVETLSAAEWAQALVAYRELDDKEKLLHAAIGAYRHDLSPAARLVVKDALTCLGRYEEAYQVVSEALRSVRSEHSNTQQVLRAYTEAYIRLCAYTQRWDLCKSALESDDFELQSSSFDPRLVWRGEMTDALALVGPVVRPGRGIGDFLMLAWWSQFLYCFAPEVCLVVSKEDQNTLAPLFKFLKTRGICIVDANHIPRAAKHVYGMMFWQLADFMPERIYDIMSFLPAWPANAPMQFKYAKLKVGLCHTALAAEDKDVVIKRRQLTPSNIDRLVESTKDVIQWVNLQYNTHDSRMLNPNIKDWERTANVVAGTDIVCSVDTSTMHLAAGLRKETWVPQNTIADIKFAWTCGDKCMVYPTVKVFRSVDFRFDGAIDKIIEALRERARSATPQLGREEQFRF
jgi:hypothetical protein